jgi:hypothetical protein
VNKIKGIDSDEQKTATPQVSLFYHSRYMSVSLPVLV